MRRLIQAAGAEVIHLGHNRSVADVVRAAIQEDADAIALSSYQGGHLEYFRYAIDMLREAGAGAHPRVRRRRRDDHGGRGGGARGVRRRARLLTGRRPQARPDGDDRRPRRARPGRATADPRARRCSTPGDDLAVARMLSALEDGAIGSGELALLEAEWSVRGAGVPVVGITGTGGARARAPSRTRSWRGSWPTFPELRVAVVAVDPTRRRTGGALLGDRIRMNSLRSDRVFMRSIATRRQNLATSAMLSSAVSFLRAQGFGLVLVETAGIGQSDSEIVDLADVPVYVMTSEYGAASQLEKIDMLDLASVIVVNKADKRGADDALRDVRKQWRRNRVAFGVADEEIPVFATVASQFGDPGVNRVFLALCALLAERAGDGAAQWAPPCRPRRPRVEGGRDDPRRAHRLPVRDRGRGTRGQRRASRRSRRTRIWPSISTRRCARSATRSCRSRSTRPSRPLPMQCSIPCAPATTRRSRRSGRRRSPCSAPGPPGARASRERRTATTCAAGPSPAPTTGTR